MSKAKKKGTSLSPLNDCCNDIFPISVNPYRTGVDVVLPARQDENFASLWVSRTTLRWRTHPWQAWPLPQIFNKLKSSRQSGLVSYFHFLTYDSIYRTTATCCDQDVFSCLKMPMFAPSLPTPSNCKYADLASQSQLMLVKDHRICTWTHITSLSHLFRVDVITDHHRGAVTLPCYALGNLLPCSSPSFSRSYLSRVAQVKTLLNRVSSTYLYSTLMLLRLRTLNLITAPKYCYSFAC